MGKHSFSMTFCFLEKLHTVIEHAKMGQIYFNLTAFLNAEDFQMRPKNDPLIF